MEDADRPKADEANTLARVKKGSGIKRFLLYGGSAIAIAAIVTTVLILSRSDETAPTIPSRLKQVPEGLQAVGQGENILLFSDREGAEGYRSAPRTYLEEHPEFTLIQVGSYAVGTETAAGKLARDTDIQAFVAGLYGSENILEASHRKVDAGPGIQFRVRWQVTPGDVSLGEVALKEFWVWIGDQLNFVAQRRGLKSQTVDIDKAYESIIASLKGSS